MSRENRQDENRSAGILYLLAGVLSLLASIFWFLAKNIGQGFMCLGLASLWAGFSIPRLRKKEPIQPPVPSRGNGP